MTDYVKSTNFASKDSLATGNPLKIVKGTEFDTEFNNIATAVATKADIANPTFTGVPSAPTATPGTNTTQLATTAFVGAAITAYDTALTVSTAQIEDDAVTAAKIVAGAVGNSELATDAVTQAKISDNAVGTAEIIDANVTPAKLSQPLTLGTSVATTSGTTANFTSIPSWVTRITIVFNGVSTNGTSHKLVQLGSGSITASGYTAISTFSSNVSTTYTTGFGICSGIASESVTGTMTLIRITSTLWVSTSVCSSYAVGMLSGSGIVTLSGALDRVRLTTVNGTDTFDAGSVNILYE